MVCLCAFSCLISPDSLRLEQVKLVVKPVQHCVLNRNQWQKHILCYPRLSYLANDYSSSNNKSLHRKISKRLKKYGIHATLQDGLASNPENGHVWSSFKSLVIKPLNALYQFSRPHTVAGTIIGITSVSLLPVETIVDLSPSFYQGLLKALVPSVLMNIYVVGLNQLFDVEIDKINKPHLPLASGNFSMGTGIIIVSASLLMSLGMGVMFQSPPLLSALVISFMLGTVYSIELPLLRWKKQAFLAASCILIVRAIVVQLAFFLHTQKFVLGKPVVITRSLVFATAFMCFFSAVIALFKDIPDVQGDKDFDIQSFSVSLGQERVFWLCVNMLLIAYGVAIVVGASSSFLPSKLITMLGHCTLASILWHQAQSVDLTSKLSITSFYMFIWKLFYAEYFLIPFVSNYQQRLGHQAMDEVSAFCNPVKLATKNLNQKAQTVKKMLGLRPFEMAGIQKHCKQCNKT